jgi:hypothetical protein
MPSYKPVAAPHFELVKDTFKDFFEIHLNVIPHLRLGTATGLSFFTKITRKS